MALIAYARRLMLTCQAGLRVYILVRVFIYILLVYEDESFYLLDNAVCTKITCISLVFGSIIVCITRRLIIPESFSPQLPTERIAKILIRLIGVFCFAYTHWLALKMGNKQTVGKCLKNADYTTF